MVQIDRTHAGDLYLPSDTEILNEQFKCLEKLYDYNATRPSEQEKRSKMIMDMSAEIGDNTVIGAGSVVTKDIPAGIVAVGNPCKVLRTIGERDREYYFKDRKTDYSDEHISKTVDEYDRTNH